MSLTSHLFPSIEATKSSRPPKSNNLLIHLERFSLNHRVIQESSRETDTDLLYLADRTPVHNASGSSATLKKALIAVKALVVLQVILIFLF
jgi:hypothetical protein